MKKLHLLFIVFLAVSFNIKGQDPHFSQFFSSPLTLNPALTGKFDGTIRVATNYRNQLPTFNNAYTTSTVSVDFSVLQKNLPENDTWGVGLIGLTDKAASGILKSNYFGVSTSYHKALNEDGYSQLGLGFQAVYAQRSLDLSKLVFEDQLTSNGFDLTVPSSDIALIKKPNISYVDINSGLIFTTSTNDRNNFYVGVSMYHINRPKESFNGGNLNINPRTTVSGGGYFPFATGLTMHVSSIYQLQNQSSELLFGGALSKSLNNDESNPSNIYAGAWMRLKDAIIPYVGLEFNGIRIGATYDVNTSSLKSGSQSRGGFELSLIYIKRPAVGRNLPCPKF